ncbi:MAG: hypothetical protein ACR2LX_15860 [Jatrophihabitans sp.]
MSVRPICAVVGVAVLAVGIALGSSPAGGADAHPQSVRGSGLVGLGSGLNGFQIDFAATKSAAGKVSGQFHGSGRLTALGVAIPLPVTLSGPVTCLTVKGDTAAFRYPVTVEPTALQPLLQGTSVEITVKQGTVGSPTKIGFFGPVPTALLPSCDGTPPVFTLEGTASVDAG